MEEVRLIHGLLLVCRAVQDGASINERLFKTLPNHKVINKVATEKD